MDRAPGLSVRVRLTLSYAGFLMLAGVLLLAAVWWFLLRYVPDRAMLINPDVRPANGVFPIRSALLSVFAPRAAAVLAFLLVLGLLGGWILAGRMLAPLTRITDATRTATHGSLSHRIQLPGRKDEFRELADSFDVMLARLEAHVAEQRRFAANASHELRTPLAVSKTLLDLARTDPNHDTGATIDRLHAVNARAIALTEALLLLGRANQRSFTAEPVDLSLLAEEATETLLPLAEKHGITIETDGGLTPTAGSSALLLQLTTNLVHNAIVHNLPGEGSVWVNTGVRRNSVVLTVENTGESISPLLAATLTEPFQRGTERVHTGHAGVGLGLAIVRTIAQAHDGTLTLTPRACGGIRVTVELPATSRAPTAREDSAH
ncbi:HAMP domain-containing sensor histidine kinase [Streptomyces sp. WI04-05B]|uniref:sensor histidine kinase n=1 Tax=Streptomyces TaxID=1883 RepID=UPI0029AE6F80|nr:MULTISPECIES: HAMP domain-containing sensor histidine kinase [unclassified Streptomyces]MDX2541402.1 HAMP domain-containing sensor histidine kinase [Streptomyces sp. WI04-05B]MDX2583864.1 HAMP domain-containing sensor histidine kinase [Streptomyces sp. WI04-05A]MDX3745647.1 HAMP domain-containing sensor histidine kinase [Streptomyces sp. AK08-02]